MTLTIGEILQGRYRIDALLGQGGMGAVHRAYDLTLSRVCAVKEMTPPHCNDVVALGLGLTKADGVFGQENHLALPV